MSYAIICLAFLVYIYKREQQVKEERQDLLDRIMAKSFEDYKEKTAEPVTYEPVSVSEEDEYWREIEEQKQ